MRFVVESTLEGRAEAIKGYTIGTLVFGRPDDFDPSVDPIVRVEAVRLRSALARYYEGEGSRDPVVISIPAGGYVPKFTFRKVAGNGGNGAAAPAGPMSEVLQQRNGDMAEFRSIVARMRKSIADFDTEIMVSRFIVTQSEAIIERDQRTGPYAGGPGGADGPAPANARTKSGSRRKSGAPKSPRGR